MATGGRCTHVCRHYVMLPPDDFFDRVHESVATMEEPERGPGINSIITLLFLSEIFEATRRSKAFSRTKGRNA